MVVSIAAVLARGSVLEQYILEVSRTIWCCRCSGAAPFLRPPRRCTATVSVPRVVSATQLERFCTAPASGHNGACSHSIGWNSNDMGRVHCALALISVAKLYSVCFPSSIIVYAIGGLKLANVLTSDWKLGSQEASLGSTKCKNDIMGVLAATLSGCVG